MSPLKGRKKKKVNCHTAVLLIRPAQFFFLHRTLERMIVVGLVGDWVGTDGHTLGGEVDSSAVVGELEEGEQRAEKARGSKGEGPRGGVIGEEQREKGRRSRSERREWCHQSAHSHLWQTTTCHCHIACLKYEDHWDPLLARSLQPSLMFHP